MARKAVADRVCVDLEASARVASMRVGGMSVLERVLREAAQAGARVAIVRGDPAALPTLPALALAVETVLPGQPIPADARVIPGDVVAGVRITDARTRRQAEWALLQACRRPHDGIGDRYVIRPISLRLTRGFARLGATPNQVTAANIVVGLAACALAATGGRAGFAAAGALMWLQVVLDSCDGELARVRHRGSRLGMWLDNVSDDVIDNLFVAALGVGLGGIGLVIGVVAASLRGLCALMIYQQLARAGTPGDVMAFRWWFDRADDQLAERYQPTITPLALLRGIGRRDLYVLLLGAAAVVGLPWVALGLGSTIGVAYFGLGVVHVVVRRRR